MDTYCVAPRAASPTGTPDEELLDELELPVELVEVELVELELLSPPLEELVLVDELEDELPDASPLDELVVVELDELEEELVELLELSPPLELPGLTSS